MRGVLIAVIMTGATIAAGCARSPRPRAPHESLAPSRAHTTAPRVAAFQPMRRAPTPTPAVAAARPIVHARRGDDGAAGTVSDAAFLHQLRAREPGLHHCFAVALRGDPGLRRIKVPIRIRIDAGGRVARASAAGGSERLDACVAAVVGRMSFPPPGAPIEIEVPLLFTARS